VSEQIEAQQEAARYLSLEGRAALTACRFQTRSGFLFVAENKELRDA
jgi:hypothetical protein